MGWACSVCGEEHDDLPELAFDEPDAWSRLDDDERARSLLDGDGCEIHSAAGDFYFVRGVLELPLEDSPGSWAFGVWCALTKAGYDRYSELFHDPAHVGERPWPSRLGNELPGYPRSLNLKGRISVPEVGLRGALLLDDADHPLVRDQREGVRLQRVLELVEPVVHA